MHTASLVPPTTTCPVLKDREHWDVRNDHTRTTSLLKTANIIGEKNGAKCTGHVRGYVLLRDKIDFSSSVADKYRGWRYGRIKGGRNVATLLRYLSRTCSNAAQVKRAWATVSSCLQNGHGATRHFLSLENNVKTGSTPHLACEMVTLTTPVEGVTDAEVIYLLLLVLGMSVLIF